MAQKNHQPIDAERDDHRDDVGLLHNQEVEGSHDQPGHDEPADHSQLAAQLEPPVQAGAAEIARASRGRRGLDAEDDLLANGDMLSLDAAFCPSFTAILIGVRVCPSRWRESGSR